MNRYSKLKESDFKSDVSTNSTKRAYKYIPQFDLLTIGSQTFGLLISLSFFYYYCVTKSISNFIEIKKLRSKKLLKNYKSAVDVDQDLNHNLWLINYSYVKFLNTKMGI